MVEEARRNIGDEMTIELKIASEKDAEKWDKLVDSSPNGTIFHTWKWLRIAENYSRAKLYPLICSKNGIPMGIIPLFHRSKAFFHLVFSPPPNVDIPFLGPLVISAENPQNELYPEFVRAVHDFTYDKLNPNYLSMTLPPGQNDLRQYIRSGYLIDPHFNYLFDLDLGKKELWQNLKKQTRKNINKAKKRLEVVDGNIKDLHFIFSQLEGRYKEQKRGLKSSLGYLEEVYSTFGGDIQILKAEMEGEIIAGLVNIIYKDKIYSWIGNAKTNLSNIYPNDLLIWASIEYGCENGFKTFYEIGARDPRLARYKSNFNPALIVNFSVKKSSLLFRVAESIYARYLRNYISL